MGTPINAVKILRSKLKFLVKAVKESPEVRQNKDFMRRLNQVVNSSQIATADEFDAQHFQEFTDCATINLLASVTQSIEQIQSLVTDYKIGGEGGGESHGLAPIHSGRRGGQHRQMNH